MRFEFLFHYLILLVTFSDFLWLIPHCICQVLPFLFYAYCCYAFYVVFAPMQGRESSSNPELLIGGYTAIFCLLLSPFLVPLICLFRKSKTIISLFGICTIVFIILAATPVGFPYVEKTAVQRFFAVVSLQRIHSHLSFIYIIYFRVFSTQHEPSTMEMQQAQSTILTPVFMYCQWIDIPIPWIAYCLRIPTIQRPIAVNVRQK